MKSKQHPTWFRPGFLDKKMDTRKIDPRMIDPRMASRIIDPSMASKMAMEESDARMALRMQKEEVEARMAAMDFDEYDKGDFPDMLGMYGFSQKEQSQKLVDNDFFNSFEDDFDDTDIN